MLFTLKMSPLNTISSPANHRPTLTAWYKLNTKLHKNFANISLLPHFTLFYFLWNSSVRPHTLISMEWGTWSCMGGIYNTKCIKLQICTQKNKDEVKRVSAIEIPQLFCPPLLENVPLFQSLHGTLKIVVHGRKTKKW